MTDRSNIYTVVMAGGKGERFWPQSRQNCPKQLLRLLGNLTLIEQTTARMLSLCDPANCLVMTNIDYVEPMRSLLPREMKAVIVTGGKQYTVAEGDVLYIEKLGAEAEATVKFEQVLAILDGENTKIGAPVVEGAAVEAKVVKNGKAKKITVFKYKPKKQEKKKIGHRQPYTKVEITKIAL